MARTRKRYLNPSNLINFDRNIKTYMKMSSVRKVINKTPLKYMKYDIILVQGGYTAEFECVSDLEKEAVKKAKFRIKKNDN